MKTAIKVVVGILVGIIIGALGFWMLQSQLGATPIGGSKANANTKDVLDNNSVKRGVKLESKSDEAEQSADSEKLRGTEAELAQALQQLERMQSAQGRSPSQSGVKTGAMPNAANQSREDNDDRKDYYLDGISEDYHQLLDPPKRRKNLPELHEDFVDEEADLSWALAMEQQIRNFKENHVNAGYVQDFVIQCKATMCEMYGKMDTEFMVQWDELNNDMVAQGWWDFRGTSNSGTTINDGAAYVNVRIFQRITD